MLDKLNLLNGKSQAIVERFLVHRNAIAHGQKGLYEDWAIYPLKPFFTQINDIYESIETIRIATGRTIAAYKGLGLWQKEWDSLMETEPAPYELVQKFQRNKSLINLSPDDFISGTVDGVTPGVLAYYFLKGKLKPIPFEQILTDFVVQVIPDEDNAMDLLYITIVLADSSNQTTAARYRDTISQLRQSDWTARSTYSDVLKEIEHQGFSLSWFPEFLKK